MKKITSEKKGRVDWILAALFLCLFLGLIALLRLVDVRAIGPNGSQIGLAGLNGAVRDALGESPFWYTLTEWLGALALAVAVGFGILGLGQAIRRRSLWRMDRDLWCLAGLYVAVMAAYVLFELLVVNRRPVLTEGEFEASFPSSHTMLVLCVMGTAIHQLLHRLKARPARIGAVTACGLVMALTAVGRLASGVHWFTDILGGLLLSGALIFAYLGLCSRNP